MSNSQQCTISWYRLTALLDLPIENVLLFGTQAKLHPPLMSDSLEVTSSQEGEVRHGTGASGGHPNCKKKASNDDGEQRLENGSLQLSLLVFYRVGRKAAE